MNQPNSLKNVISRREPPSIKDLSISESTWRFLFTKINWFIIKLYDISSGKDFRLLFLVNQYIQFKTFKYKFHPKLIWILKLVYRSSHSRLLFHYGYYQWLETISAL